jgi:drug/metabolite transporter (DMT)-like permease
MKNRPEHVQGLIFACLGALALTPDGLLVRLVGVSDLKTIFWRGFFIAVALFLVQLIQHKHKVFSAVVLQSKKEWAAAVFSALSTTSFVLAITHTTVANVLVILSTMSLFSALLSMIFLKEGIALRTWLAMFAAIAGIIIVFMDDLNGAGLSGKLFALGCAFMTSANMTIIRSEKRIKIPAVYIASGLMVAIPSFFFSTTNLAIDMKTSMTFMVMAALNAVAFVLLAAGAKRIPSPEVSLLMLLETIIGPVWVWFVLTETPSVNAVIGGSIVVGTLALHSIASLKAQKNKI